MSAMAAAIMSDFRIQFSPTSVHRTLDCWLCVCMSKPAGYACLSTESSLGHVMQVTLYAWMPFASASQGGVAGQVLQQLIELEKYRVLACMGLPFAQAVGTRIDELNAELQSVMDDISLSRKNQFNDLDTQRRLLDRLCALTAITLKVSASSHYRFSASSAYSKIVDDRISFLQMAEMQELPSMSAFLKRVLDPAIRTCDH
eukprot:2099099-Pleurochrysis_carterae.AAC.1